MGVLLLQRVNVGDLTTCRGKFLAELSIHQLHVPGIFPGLPERPLDFLHSISQLLVALLQRRHFLLQLLHSVLLLKQSLLHRGAHELWGQQQVRFTQKVIIARVNSGIPENTSQLSKSRMLFGGGKFYSGVISFFSKILSFTCGFS